MATDQQLSPSDALSALLALLALSSDTETPSKALAGARLASQAGQYAGVPGAGAIGGAAGAAGFGLTLADLASRDDLSTMDKVGQGVGGAFDLGASALIPYYGLSKLAAGVGGALSKSSSPQVSALGRTVNWAAEPGGAKMFNASIRGQNPFKGASTHDIGEELTLDLLGPIGAVLRGVGLGGKVASGLMDYGPLPGMGQVLKLFGGEPTEGTKFRSGIASAFKRIPGFETFAGGADRTYDMTPEALAKFDPKDVAAATTLARLAAPAATRYGDKQSAYLDQVRNMLLNLYGHPGELMSKLPAALDWLTTQGGK